MRALVDTADIPQGTPGVVIDAIPAGAGYDVCVEWQTDSDSIFQDWFSKDEYVRFLEEMP